MPRLKAAALSVIASVERRQEQMEWSQKICAIESSIEFAASRVAQPRACPLKTRGLVHTSLRVRSGKSDAGYFIRHRLLSFSTSSSTSRSNSALLSVVAPLVWTPRLAASP